MTGRGHELVDLMERRKVKAMCLQETKWKGSKARELGDGFKLFYVGEDGRSWVGFVLDYELRRPSDRIIWLKVEIGEIIVNIMSAYAPQQGCTDEEKEKFWEELDEEVRKVPAEEKFWVGGDFNGHVGSDNTGREETVGRYCYCDKNYGGEELVAFAIRHLWIVNTFYKKAPRHKITYQTKRAVAVAKARAYERLYEDLDTAEGMEKVLRMAKQKDKNSKDIYQMKLINSEEGYVLTKDEEILERWRTSFMRLMNEENPREVQDGEQAENWKEVEAITEDKVKRALKKM
ncbi:uncharacterized protein LOC125033631 [Penaeus chinensis]|uniref:uncharacterized protein LOC125033631 n=1 Tax=Penaeus chinensis TaxID=139456 RepID=UPI001FB84EB8|nr:uncharacterized protein LOC125033631 [Penaeus chinensis]